MGLSSAVAAALIVAALSPYLARLTVSVPDRDDAFWWRARRPCSTARAAVVGAVGLVCGGLAGAAAGRADWAAFVWLGLVVTPLVVIDVEHHRLPDRLVLAALIGGTVLLGVATLVDGDISALARAPTAAMGVFVLFSVLTLGTGFGFGDAKLLAVLAGYLGWLGWGYVWCGVAAGFCAGGVVSLLLVLSRRVSLKTAVPFGPALVTGALLVSALGLGLGPGPLP